MFGRRLVVAPAMVLIVIAAIACSSGISPAGAQDPSGVIVPDDISSLDSDEVERRLGRLLGGEDVATGQAAPVIQPTAVPEVPDEPTLEEILALLNSATPVAGSGEIVISVSPETFLSLAHPVLTIKTQPSHGSATVISPNQILYMPDGTGDGSDAFEYELFDAETHVISQVMEIRR